MKTYLRYGLDLWMIINMFDQYVWLCLLACRALVERPDTFYPWQIGCSKIPIGNSWNVSLTLQILPQSWFPSSALFFEAFIQPAIVLVRNPFLSMGNRLLLGNLNLHVIWSLNRLLLLELGQRKKVHLNLYSATLQCQFSPLFFLQSHTKSIRTNPPGGYATE